MIGELKMNIRSLLGVEATENAAVDNTARGDMVAPDSRAEKRRSRQHTNVINVSMRVQVSLANAKVSALQPCSSKTDFAMK